MHFKFKTIKELWYSMVFHIQVKMLLELIYFNIDAIYILIQKAFLK